MTRKSRLQDKRDAEKSQRLARIRHELRTPINHIIGYSELLLDEEDLPRAFVDDLNKIRAGGRRLLQLIAEYFNIDSPAQRSADEAQIYHELRTPVNQIIGYSELLQEQAEEQKRDRISSDLQQIHHAARAWLAQAEHHLLPSNSPKGARSATRPDAIHAPSTGSQFAIPGTSGRHR
jgi:signal transduction histidine kinase